MRWCNYLLVCITVLFIMLFISNISAETNDSRITGNTITGESITGKPIFQFGLNVTLVATPPDIIIIKPRNQTYIGNDSLILNFSATGARVIWYNIDNGENITITSTTYLNISQGYHILYLFANNSDGNLTAKNVTFYVNNSQFSVTNTKYSGEYKGNSTLFNYHDYEELQNLSNIILEDTRHGKIYFNDLINLTGDDDEDDFDYEIDIDSYINITSNFIYIDTNYLPNFNKEATLYLYDLNFSNPTIQKDGVTCPSNICTQQSYSGGVLVFNVTHFTSYSSSESSGGAESGSTASSGSGTGNGILSEDFIVSPQSLKIPVRIGEKTTSQITITNNLGESGEFSVSMGQEIEKLIKINEKDFILSRGSSKTITLEIEIPEDIKPDLYSGEIIVSSERSGNKNIFVIIEVKSKDSLFDVSVEILENYRYVIPGGKLLSNIELFDVSGQKKSDVEIDYEIRNRNNEIILASSETVGVETRASLIKEFIIPENTKEGDYILYVKLSFNGQVASASEQFVVGKKSISRGEIVIYIISITLLISVIIMIWEIRKIKREIKRYHQITEQDLIKAGYIKRKKR